MNEPVRLLFSHNFVKAREPLGGRRVLLGIAHNDFTFVLRLDQVFQRLRRLGRLDRLLVINDSDDNVAVSWPEIRIDHLFRKTLRRGRIVLRQHTVLQQYLHRRGIVDQHVEERLSGAKLADRSFHYFGGRSSPIFHFDSGLFEKCIPDRIARVGVERSINDDFASFFFRRFHQLCILGERCCAH